MNRSRSALALACSLSFAVAHSAPGDIDPAFGANGVRVVNWDAGGSNADKPGGLRADAQGRIVVSGTASAASGGDRLAIARMSANGAMDAPFGPANTGKVTFAESMTLGSHASAVSIGYGPCAVGDTVLDQPSPLRIAHAMCVGETGELEGDYSGNLLDTTELTAASTPVSNNSFEITPVAGVIGTGTSRDFLVTSMFREKESSSGLISISGDFGQTSGITRIPFDLGNQARVDVATELLRIPDGSGFWVTGYAQFSNQDHDFAVARLHADGTLDTGFDTDGKETFSFDVANSNRDDRATAAAIDPQGRLVIAGTASRDATGADLDIALLRMLPDGTPDTSFGPNGRRLYSFDALLPARRDEVAAIAIDSESRIYIVGTLYSGEPANVSDIAVLRVDADGEIDVEFGTQGRSRYGFSNPNTVSADHGADLLLQPEGLVVLGDKMFNNTDTDLVVFRASLTPSGDAVFRDSFEEDVW